MQHLQRYKKSVPSLPAGLLFSLLIGLSLSAHAEVSNATASTHHNDALSATKIKTQSCPDAFYQVKLPDNGKLCQVFATDLPASMIFYVPLTPSEVVDYYKQDNTVFDSSKRVKDRYLLQSSDKNTTLIISSDGKGTQVDVLVKNTQT